MKVMSKGQAHHSGLSKYADRDEPSSATRMVISPWGRVQVFSTAAVASAGTRLMGISQSPPCAWSPPCAGHSPRRGLGHPAENYGKPRRPEALLPAVSVIAAPQGIQCTVKDDFVVLIEQHLFPGGQDQAVAQRPLTRPPGHIPGHLPQAEGVPTWISSSSVPPWRVPSIW